jgi:hypothetical protein
MKSKDFLKYVKEELKKDGLGINNDSQKTNIFDVSRSRSNFRFDYLGYRFEVANDGFQVKLSQKKINKYKERLRSIIQDYNSRCSKEPKRSLRILKLRLKFLTSNTRLSNNKGKALVGIYNTNKWISDSRHISVLDEKLASISELIGDNNVRNKISKFSFQQGFEANLYSRFTLTELELIVGVWK